MCIYCDLTCCLLMIVPAPISIDVTSDPVSSIQPVESDVTLTCTVELSPAVNVPVTVNTVWTGPNGFMTTNTAQPVIGSTTTYTSTAMVSSFGRDQSGDYICSVIVSSAHMNISTSDSKSDTLRITVGRTVLIIFIGNCVVYHSIIIIVKIFMCLSLSRSME